MNHHKIFSYSQIVDEATQFLNLRASNIHFPLTFTNGCFDMLHAGHVKLFHAAKELAGASSKLIVGVNSDKSVKSLKGDSRPIIPQEQRAYLIASLSCVDYVFVFDDEDVSGILEDLCVDFWVKGGEYNPDTINPKELAVLDRLPTQLACLPMLDGVNTTQIINEIHHRHRQHDLRDAKLRLSKLAALG